MHIIHHHDEIPWEWLKEWQEQSDQEVIKCIIAALGALLETLSIREGGRPDSQPRPRTKASTPYISFLPRDKLKRSSVGVLFDMTYVHLGPAPASTRAGRGGLPSRHLVLIIEQNPI
ncbi:hypothetical protein Pcinc_034488 [Petrolisthes cinctipes]|uniref:Uncharacterized protein n=1 Tax=Petrolisthes cinctipes TaxID=88211 RepID=A0AAE1EQ75_PETCI|nr:hypothetical protein Pcinc_034488 [Petrolisthes cinctipes]